MKVSQAEAREVLKALEDVVASVYEQIDVDESVSLGMFLVDKKVKKGREGVMKTKEGKETPFKTEDKEVVKIRLKKSVAKRIQGE